MSKRTAQDCTPPLDEPRFWELMAGHQELLIEVAEQFLEDAPHHKHDLSLALRRCDPRALFMASHKLKGALLNLAADRAVAQTGVLEALGAEGKVDGAQPLLTELQVSLDGLCAQLQGLVRRLRAPSA